jgi:hypothetical protein
MLNGKSKIKQIEGLDGILQNLINHDGFLDTAVGNIQIGIPTLLGKVAQIPFTDAAGVTVVRTLDLSTIDHDINIASASIAPNSFDITITETDGSETVVPLKTLFDKYYDEVIKPILDLKASQVSVDALAGRVTTVEGDVASKASQASVDTLTGRVTTVEGDVASKASQASVDTLAGRMTTVEGAVAAAQTTASEAEAKAEAAQAAAEAAQSDADATALVVASQATRISTLETNQILGSTPISLIGKGTTNDGDVASDDVVPANVKFITGLYVNGEFVLWGSKTKAAYFSKDGGATAVLTNLGGSKLYWNKTVIDYNIASDDQITLIALV